MGPVMRIILRIAIPILFLAAGYGVMQLFQRGEEKPAYKRAERELPVAEVVELRRQSFQLILTAQGLVRPRNETSLTPRVAGRVHTISEHFEAGAFFKKGEVLLELDTTDFELQVAQGEAQLARSEAALAQEVARAEQALLDWDDLGYKDPPSELVRRKPQLKEAKANVKAAEAQLLGAQRDLERTQILAPYDGCIRSCSIGLGQSVSSGTTLGEIFSTDHAEVRLPLSAEDLAFVHLPEEDPSRVITATLTDALQPTGEQSWEARIVRSEGVLDETSRELFVTARVNDPYGIDNNNPPLRVGQPVLAKITGKLLENVYVIPRSSLRNPTEIVLVDPETSTIERTKITPLWSNETQIIVDQEFPEGWLLVLSRLPVAANGTEVKTVAPGEAHKAVKNPEEDSKTEEDSEA
jgi:RND family efflux transporter MFP subunit